MFERKRRSELDIIADILGILSEKTQSITKIMYKANLSYNLTKYYVDRLLSLGLIEKIEREYCITDKGIKFLIIYSFIKSVIGEKVEFNSRIIHSNNISEILKLKEYLELLSGRGLGEVSPLVEKGTSKRIEELKELKEVIPEELPGCGLWACGTSER